MNRRLVRESTECKTRQGFQWIPAVFSLVVLILSGCVGFYPELAVTFINDQDELARFAMESRDYEACEAALWKIKDQALIEKIARDHRSVPLRCQAVQKMENQEALADIAWNADSVELKKTAFYHITNETLLVKFALESPYGDIRERAVREIDDPALLERVAMTEQSLAVRQAAILRVTNEWVLAQVAWNTRDDLALHACSNQAALAEVARQASIKYPDQIGWWREDRYLKKITDQQLLKSLVLGAKEDSIRQQAMHSITNQQVLAEIALSAQPQSLWNNNEYADRAAEELADPALAAMVLKASKDGDVRQNVVTKVSDPELLLATALNDEHPNVRSLAVWQLGKRGFTNELVRVAKEAKDWNQRCGAVGHISDQAVLTSIAWKDEVSDVQERAVDGIADQAVLIELARKGPWGTRMAAIPKIDDQEVLCELAGIDSHATAYAAFQRIVRQDLLEKLALEAHGDGIRESAAAKIDNEEILKTLAERPEDPVRYIARFRLLLLHPLCKERLGDVQVSTLREYGSVPYVMGGNVEGEWVTWELRIKTLMWPIAVKWQTYFPNELPLGSSMFHGMNPAKLDLADAAAKLFFLLPADDIAMFASNHPDADIRRGAVRCLTDQSLLERIISTVEDASVRSAASNALMRAKGEISVP